MISKIMKKKIKIRILLMIIILMEMILKILKIMNQQKK